MLETYHKPQQPEIKRKTACQLANSRDYQDVFNVPEKEEAAWNKHYIENDFLAKQYQKKRNQENIAFSHVVNDCCKYLTFVTATRFCFGLVQIKRIDIAVLGFFWS